MRRWCPLILIAMLGLSGCAIGVPGPPYKVKTTSATLPGELRSSVDGPLEWWFKYGTDASHSAGDTPHHVLNMPADSRVWISQPLTGLAPDTQYHYQLCVKDQEEDPPRTVCSADRTFDTAGDFVYGEAKYEVGDANGRIFLGTYVFDAHSRRDGTSPAGTVRFRGRSNEIRTYDVSCVRVSGATATLGLLEVPEPHQTEAQRSFMFLEVPSAPDGKGPVVIEDIGDRSPSDCPVAPAEEPEPGVEFTLDPDSQDLGFEPLNIHDTP
jgi:hypothetical protein